MIREATARKQGRVRGRRGIPDAVPLLHRTTEVGDCPGQSVRGSRLRAKQRARAIQAQLATEIGDLAGREFGAVAAPAMISQARNTVSTIGSAPFHQAGAGT